MATDIDAETHVAIEVERSRTTRRLDKGGEIGRLDRHEARQYDAALLRISSLIANKQGVGKVVGVTSLAPGAGVSTFVANLAVRAVDLGMGPALFIDANPERPFVSRNFRVPKNPGMSEYLQQRVTLDDVVHDSGVRDLLLITQGGVGDAGFSEDEERTETALCEIRSEFPLVLVDLPHYSALGGSYLLAQKADAVLIVVGSESVRRADAEAAAKRFRQDGLNVLGAVVTHRRRYLPKWLESRL